MAAITGRPTKFTPEVLNRLYSAIRLGHTYKHACMYAGIDWSTFHAWRSGQFPKGVTDDQKQEFYDNLARAEGESVNTKLATIAMHSKDDWKAAAWMLERRHPDDYGRVVQRIEHANATNVPLDGGLHVPEVESLLSKLTLEQLDALQKLADGLSEHIIDAEVREVEPDMIEAQVRVIE